MASQKTGKKKNKQQKYTEAKLREAARKYNKNKRKPKTPSKEMEIF